MRYAIFILCTGIFTQIQSQDTAWVQIDLEGITTENLHDIEFIDEQNGWVVGDNATILHTADGGETWELQTLNTTTSLQGLCFVNANTGWVFGVGGGGVLLKTNDSGATWTAIDGPLIQPFTSIEFVDSSTGWLGGGNGVNFTQDGGDNWTEQLSMGTSSYSAPRCIHFTSPDTGWCYYYYGSVIGPVPSIKIMKTEDQGNTWVETQSIGGGIEGGWIADISTFGNNVWVTQANRLFRSTDSGNTWNSQSFFQDYPANGPGFKCVDFVSSQLGWICGEMGIIKSTDSGSSWSDESIGTTANINYLDAVSENNVWAVGDSATLLHYTIVDEVTSAEHISDSEEVLNIFPNPASDRLTLKWPNGKGQLTIFNQSGQQVLNRTITSSQTTINISSLKPGMYIAKAQEGAMYKHVRFVVAE